MRIILIIISILFPLTTNAADISTEDKQNIETIIETVKTGNRAHIAKLFLYPISMDYPNPNVLNENEFISRFDEVLDSKLINDIITSSVTENWSAVGWRGIMLDHGNLWVNFRGKIIKVNYITELHKQKKEAIIAQQKKTIHPSISQFKRTILEWDIGKFHIRIDQMNDRSYRYSSWSKSQNIGEKPDLIILNGTKYQRGTGGNHSYNFKNGNYLYRVSLFYVGPSDIPPGRLEVFHNEESILKVDLPLKR